MAGVCGHSWLALLLACLSLDILLVGPLIVLKKKNFLRVPIAFVRGVRVLIAVVVF